MTDSYYKLPDDLAADIDVYERELSRFLSGEIPSAIFKAKRVPRGIYEQRKDGSFMVRVRVPGGSLNFAQTRELAALSREFGNSLLHITTRQDVQLHDVSLENTPSILRRLLAVGLTSKGGGGNTVRNVTACPYAGVCPAERFDVTPCAHAVTEYLISRAGSYNLPRKFKIAFSGCAADCALAQVADLGFVADVRDRKPGFRVLAGGGMGAQSRIADTLLDWSPVTDIIRVAEIVRRLFDQLGDRTNKHRARLRFVFDRIGIEEFRRRYAERALEVVREGVPAWTKICPITGDSQAVPPHPQYHEGIQVIAQRQSGFFTVPLHAPLGFLPAGDLERIAEAAAHYSRENGLRTTQSQNLLLRFVRRTDLQALVSHLRSLETDLLLPTSLDRFVACAGASTCRLGICLARNAAQACADALAQSAVSRETLADMEFNVNGCPNACGQQPIAQIGFFGVAQRVADRLVPSYAVTIGGRCGVEGARFGTFVGKVPAAALPKFVQDLAFDFQSQRKHGESFPAYLDRVGQAHFQAIVARYSAIPAVEEHPEFYRDLGAEETFSLAGRGAGECGAGVIEVIQQDIAAAKKAADPFEMLIPTARALLITRGVDAQDADTVLREFERHFIETGLVAKEFRELLIRGRGYVQGWQNALAGQESAIARLRERVELLFSTMDANLQFHPPDKPSVTTPNAVLPSHNQANSHGAAITAELDLRGVACPMNFVKAKLKLETMNIGETLAIILDDGEPIRNVPASFKAENQDVGDITNLGNGHWRVVVRKRV